jgi:uncharacterized protein (DUF1778 family)
MSHALIACKVRAEAEKTVEHLAHNMTAFVLSAASAEVEEAVQHLAHKRLRVFSVRHDLRLMKQLSIEHVIR